MDYIIVNFANEKINGKNAAAALVKHLSAC